MGPGHARQCFQAVFLTVALAACHKAPPPPAAPAAAAAPAKAPTPQRRVFTTPADYTLSFEPRTGEGPKLTWGAPGSDDLQLLMVCTPGLGTVTIRDLWHEGSDFTMRSMEITADLEGKEVRADSGESWAEADVSPDAPVLAAFRDTGRLILISGQSDLRIEAGVAEKAKIAAFLKACGAS